MTTSGLNELTRLYGYEVLGRIRLRAAFWRALDIQEERFIGRSANNLRELRRIGDRLAIHFKDHVTLLETGFLSSTALFYSRDYQAARATGSPYGAPLGCRLDRDAQAGTVARILTAAVVGRDFLAISRSEDNVEVSLITIAERLQVNRRLGIQRSDAHAEVSRIGYL